ncbi:MAG: hypothetical protein WKF95_19545 [Rubrobacter sp.]
MDEASVLVHPDAARRQIRDDEANRTPTPPPIPGGEDGGSGGGVGGEGPDGGGIAQPLVPPEPAPELSKRFHGVVEIDPARLGGSAGAISQEVVQRLASIMGSNVHVTLEIRADVPDGIPEKVERDVSENCNTLRFREHDFG